MKWLKRVPPLAWLVLVFTLGGLGAGAWFFWVNRSDSNNVIGRWYATLDNRPALTNLRANACPNAPFILPSNGLIGLLYGDPAAPYSFTRRHTGIDIFGDGGPNEVPIYAVYDGLLTRRDDWLSTVIIRHTDPLQPNRTIWTYYTHMASEDGQTSYVADAFPRGSADIAVKQGDLLGYQGLYAGPSGMIGLHVHFSIVLSDENGNFLNEARLENTIDPSPYFGMSLNINTSAPRPIACN
jgi:peptidoglycan LD-endopeptidase LytH